MRINWCSAVLGLWLSHAAYAGSPQLDDLLPVAGQRGQDVEVTFHGARLHDVTDALFHTPGITANELVFKDNKVRATLNIAPDAPVGEHHVRLVTKTGVTEMVTFQVVDRPIIQEQTEEPVQPIDLDTMVLGRIESEEVDRFAVTLKKGQPFAAEVIGVRLGRGFTDLTLTVFDDQNNVITSVDDTLRHRQDPAVSFIAPRDGRYVLALRDSIHLGSKDHWYLLHVGEAVRPALVYPLGGQPGQTLDLRMLGDAGGRFRQTAMLPKQEDALFEVIANYKGTAALSGLPMRVNRLTNVLEDPATANNNMNQARQFKAHPLPVALNGIIDRPGDQDFFKVRLAKGQRVAFRCYARSMGSPLDAVVNVFDADAKKHLQGNDDNQRHPDSMVMLNVPEDGDYFVRVRDHRNRGGAEFVYRLEVAVAEPGLSTAIWQYDRNRPQLRQGIAVPRGNRFAALVRVTRDEVSGDLIPQAEGLPAGVTIQGLGPDERGEVMPVVFEAGADASLAATLVDLQAVSHGDSERSDEIVGHFKQQTPVVTGNPNRTVYYDTVLDTVPVVVTESIPFDLQVIPPKAPLVHGGKQRLQVRVNRAEGYTEPVNLHLLYRPPGIGAPGRVEVKPTAEAGFYEIDANGSVPTRDWPMVVIASGKQPGGVVWASSQLFNIPVQEPFVSGTIEPARCRQGQTTMIAVELKHLRDWQGQGQLKLLGLPAHAKALPVTVEPGQDKAVFEVTTAENTPARQHRSLMCELTIMVNDEPVIHRFGQGGRLRIDRADNARAQAGDE